jgi:16S rRNA (guanine966-N2)-methyltransferase
MRVIAGSARGRRLQAPRGTLARPTSDRVREAMFSSLAAEVPHAHVLDLFAGTGALGIEALSRGARAATFVEANETVAATLRKNLQTAGVATRATVVRGDAAGFVQRPCNDPFSVVFCDPPYTHPLAGVIDLVAALHGAGGLADGAVVVVERDRRDPALSDGAGALDLRGLLAVDRQRSYGDTVLLYLRSGVRL